MKQKSENEKSSPDITKSIEKEPELVLTWLSGLTDLEQRIVSVLYQVNQAISIKQIRLTLISNTIIFYQHELPDITREINFLFPFVNHYFLPNEVREELQRKHSDISQRKQSELSFKKVTEAIAFPSFERIDKNTQELINGNIVLERSGVLENKKVKGLYYLNPTIRLHLDKLKNKRLQEHKEGLKKHKQRIDEINKELIKSGSKMLMNY